MERERIEKLIKILERVPDRRFDLDVWAVERYDEFVGDALGWASQYPDFKQAKLSYKLGRHCGMVSVVDSAGKTRCGVNAFAYFFGVSEGDAERILESEHYDVSRVRTRHVIERLWDLLAGA